MKYQDVLEDRRVLGALIIIVGVALLGVSLLFIGGEDEQEERYSSIVEYTVVTEDGEELKEVEYTAVDEEGEEFIMDGEYLTVDVFVDSPEWVRGPDEEPPRFTYPTHSGEVVFTHGDAPDEVVLWTDGADVWGYEDAEEVTVELDRSNADRVEFEDSEARDTQYYFEVELVITKSE